jgi:monoamine oxidase
VAGAQLQRAGVNVIVLEARTRVGGRVFSLREGLQDGQYADIGAEFIYPEQPLIKKLCEEHGLTLSPAFMFCADPPALLFDGRKLSQDESAAVIGQLRGTYQASPPGSYESVAAWARRNHVSKRGYEFLRGLAQITSLKELRYIDGNELDLEMSWDADYNESSAATIVYQRR